MINSTAHTNARIYQINLNMVKMHRIAFLSFHHSSSIIFLRIYNAPPQFSRSFKNTLHSAFSKFIPIRINFLFSICFCICTTDIYSSWCRCSSLLSWLFGFANGKHIRFSSHCLITILSISFHYTRHISFDRFSFEIFRISCVCVCVYVCCMVSSISFYFIRAVRNKWK